MDAGLIVGIVGGLFGIAGAATAIVTFWMKRGESEATSAAAAKAALDKAQGAENMALRCVANTDLLTQNLNDHKVATAASLASLETRVNEASRGLAQAELRLAKSIDDMGDRFERSLDHMGKRFDQMTERLDSVLASRG